MKNTKKNLSSTINNTEREEIKKKIRSLYYDWANDPEFVRIEKHGDIELADSFLLIFDSLLTNKIKEIEDKIAIEVEAWFAAHSNKEKSFMSNDLIKHLKKTLQEK